MMNNNFDILYKAKLSTVEEILNEQFPNDYRQTKLPEVLEESMRYSLFSSAKRIRPILIESTYELCGGSGDDVKPFIAAIEMIHTYSLIHDDLPCMDDDDMRRGKPTNHIIFGYPIAVLAGDGLLNLAYETMIRGALTAKNTQGYLRAMYIIAEAAGMKGMIGGQSADISWQGHPPNERELQLIHRNKTGALLKASVLAGAVCAGAEDDKIAVLDDFGTYIGDMFQIVDDILDVIGSQEDMGKKVGKDSVLNKMTYPYVYGIEKSRKFVEELEIKSLNCLNNFTENEFLAGLVGYLASRTK